MANRRRRGSRDNRSDVGQTLSSVNPVISAIFSQLLMQWFLHHLENHEPFQPYR